MARGKGNPSRLGARVGSRKGAGSAKAEDVVTGGRGQGGGTPEKGTGGAGGVSGASALFVSIEVLVC